MSRCESLESAVSRRNFLKQSSAASALPLTTAHAHESSGSPGARRPNVVLVISDQFRWDCLGRNGLNSLNLTPNLDAIASEGVNFMNAVTNQPVCAPSRACLFTSQYANRHGVWQNGIALQQQAATVAKAFRGAGYSANYIGKWHLGSPDVPGAVAPEYRGGFSDYWEGCNLLEFTSHPYEGTIWDGAGRPIHFQNEYRVDFLTGRVSRFLRQEAKQPFFLVVSYLEPHFQNDCACFVAPKGYSDRYKNSFVPADLRFFPGDWESQLPDYYGCIARVDENVGHLWRELTTLGLLKNTVFVFLSDHGCHFRTRNAEYKRSAHESSIHVPLVMSGPGFNHSLEIRELVSHIDIAPTLLDACGVGRPSSFQGRSIMPLLKREAKSWRNEVFIQISESMTGRALRTPEWTYVVVRPDGQSAASSPEYEEYQLYNLYDDPSQLVNLAGRVETSEISRALRQRLLQRMLEAGEQSSVITPRPLYP